MMSSALQGHTGILSPQRVQFAQKAFILHQGRLLVVRKSSSDPHFPGYWEVPGGRLHAGEDLDEHIRREAWEETGISIRPGQPFYLWQWTMTDRLADGSTEPVQVVAVARTCQAQSVELSSAHRTENDHIDEALWVPLQQLAGYDFIPSFKPAIRKFIELESGLFDE